MWEHKIHRISQTPEASTAGMAFLLDNKTKESSFLNENNFLHKIVQPPILIQLLKST